MPIIEFGEVMDPKEREQALLNPGPRFKIALQRYNLYFPPEIMREINDAVMAIDIGAPGRLAGSFRSAYCGLEGDFFRIKFPLAVATDKVKPTFEQILRAAAKNGYNPGLPDAPISAVKEESTGIVLMGRGLEQILRALCDGYLNPKLQEIGAPVVDYVSLLEKYTPRMRTDAQSTENETQTSDKASVAAPATGQQQQPQQVQVPGQQQQPQQKSDGAAPDQLTGFADRYVPQQPQRQQQQQAQASSRSWSERAPANDTGKAAASTVRGGGPR